MFLIFTGALPQSAITQGGAQSLRLEGWRPEGGAGLEARLGHGGSKRQ